MNRPLSILSIVVLLCIGIVGSFLYLQNGDRRINQSSGALQYNDGENNIQFRYPSAWKQNGEGDQMYFTKTPSISILQFDILSSEKKISLSEFVDEKIKEYSCEPDKILEKNERGILVTHYCSATSEDYVYYFLTGKGAIAALTYHDDFESEWTLEKKLITFKEVINSLVVGKQ